MKKLAIALVAVMLFVSVGAGNAFARGDHGGRYYGGHRGHGDGLSAKNLFLGTLAVAGGVAIVDTVFGGRYGYGYQPVVYQQPVYYQPPPVCWVEQSPVFDVYGRPVGTMPVTRCAQPY